MTRLTVIPSHPAPSRFAARRHVAADRAALELASDLSHLARDLCERARALLATASGSDLGRRLSVTQSALVSLRQAASLVDEILQEFEI